MPDPDTTNPQDSLLAFFETLCPTQEVILTINGKRYAFPTSLPARRQQATIAKMLKILDLGIVGDIPKLEGLPPLGNGRACPGDGQAPGRGWGGADPTL